MPERTLEESMLAQKRMLTLMAAVLALALLTPAAPASAATRADADWREVYFPSSDGVTQLHADVLTPKGMPIDGSVKTPVILTVTPYTNHAGGPPLSQNPYNPTGNSGPSPRF